MIQAQAASLPGFMTLANAEYAMVAVIGGAAVVEDLRRRTIPNWLPMAALAGGIACQMAASGWRGIGTALLGSVVGFLVFLVFYILGGMGGGDVKLMAGFGALLGAGRLLQAALFTAIIGGILAAVALGVHTLRHGKKESQAESRLSIPYAPAIATGVWLALVVARP